MESRIKVSYDHVNKEPYISIYMAKLNPQDDNDLRDEMLKNLIERATVLPLVLQENYEADNGNYYQLNVITEQHELHLQEKLLTHFENFARGVIDNKFPKEGNTSVMKKLEEFFEMMNSLVRPIISNKTPIGRTRRDYFELDLEQNDRIQAFEETPKDKLDEPVDNLYEAMKYVSSWRDKKGY